MSLIQTIYNHSLSWKRYEGTEKDTGAVPEVSKPGSDENLETHYKNLGPRPKSEPVSCNNTFAGVIYSREHTR